MDYEMTPRNRRYLKRINQLLDTIYKLRRRIKHLETLNIIQLHTIRSQRRTLSQIHSRARINNVQNKTQIIDTTVTLPPSFQAGTENNDSINDFNPYSLSDIRKLKDSDRK